MVDEYRDVRAAVIAADRGLQVIEGSRRGGREPPHSPARDDDACPVIALGHIDGMLHFLDTVGQRRALTTSQMARRPDLVALFGGDEDWLRKHFPHRRDVKVTGQDGTESTKSITVDFQIKGVSTFLMRACFEAGLFGDHIRIRAPGIWVGRDGQPVIHCGDGILIDARWYLPGHRTDNNVWSAAPALPRPGVACDSSVAKQLQLDMQRLFNFKAGGGAIAVLGLIGSGYFGAAAPWRPNGFFLGGPGSGKSVLLDLCRALSPLHYYTNDTTKAGLEQNVAGRAMPCLIDEAGVAVDAKAAQGLLNLVLAATGGEGTRGSRGGADGRGRLIELVGSIIMAATHPPEMQPQHLARFTLVELGPPENGDDFSVQHRELIVRARDLAPRLWARALGAFDRYMASRERFRSALQAVGCAPREMDQLGAIVAGWWVLTDEGVPNERQAREGVAALDGFVRGASLVADDDAPRRVVQHLLSTMVQLTRSTNRDQIGSLIEAAWAGVDTEEQDQERRPETAIAVLKNYGIKPVSARDDIEKRSKKPVPRGAPGDGIWIAHRVTGLTELFRATPYEGSRWLYELKRLESQRDSVGSVRIGGYSGRAVWISRNDLYPDAEDDPQRP